MVDINRVIVSGKLGRNPELRQGEGKSSFCSASIAVRSRFKDREGKWQDDTVWVNLKFFGRSAELFAQTYQKGDFVVVEGRYAIDNYEKDGVKKNFSYVKVDDWPFTKPKGQGGGQQSQQWGSQPQQTQQTQAPPPPAQPGFPDDVPF